MAKLKAEIEAQKLPSAWQRIKTIVNHLMGGSEAPQIQAEPTSALARIDVMLQHMQK